MMRMARSACIVALAFSLEIGCDRAQSSRTGTVTSRSASSLCFEPEDAEQTPECFDVAGVALPDAVQPGACVRTVASLDDRLIRVEVLERPCRPRR